MTTWTECDRCKAVVPHEETTAYQILSDDWFRESFMEVMGKDERYDLCKKCEKKLRKVVLKFIKEGEK